MDLLYRAAGAQPVAVQCAIAAVCVLALSLALTPLMRLLAMRLGDVSYPTRERDIHATPTPRLGGVAMYLAFVIGMLLFEPLTGTRIDPLSHASVNADGLLDQIRGVLLGGGVAILVGVIDELVELRPGVHFLGQCLAALTALAGGLHPVRGVANPLAGVHFLYAHPEKHLQILLQTPFPAPFGLPIVAGLLTLVWIVAMMNTVNFLDGLDGLATGVVTIAAILLAVYSSRVHANLGGPLPASEVLVLPPLILAAALLGFLFYNWAPARIFMGDSGAQWMGFTIGCLAILGPAKVGTALLILAIPILDIGWVFIRRPMSGRAFFSADREHLHQLLRDDVGLSTERIVLAFYGICVALGAIDLALSRVWKLLAFLLVAAATVALLAYVTGRHSPRNRR